MRRFYLNFVGNAHFSYFVSLLFWLFIVLRTKKKQHFFFRRIDGMRSHSTENDWFGWQHIAHSDLVGHTVHIAATGRSLWKMHIPMITSFHKSDGFLRLSIPKSNNTRDWWLSANIIGKRLVWLLLPIFFFLFLMAKPTWTDFTAVSTADEWLFLDILTHCTRQPWARILYIYSIILIDSIVVSSWWAINVSTTIRSCCELYTR